MSELDYITLWAYLRITLWAFSPVLVLGGAWALVAICQRWLAVRRVRQYQMKLLDRRMDTR